MKNPNGYGSIFKLGGKRRRPWAVRITTGWTDEGKQVFSYLGYYKTRPEAVSALAEYNNSPYDLNANKITFEDLYKIFKEEKFPKVSMSSVYSYRAGFNHSKQLHKVRFKEIKKMHLQRVIDECEKSYSVKHQIRVLFNQLFKFAIENDIADKNYAEYIDMPTKTTISSKRPFTNEEIDLLWDNINAIDGVDTVLIMIYTGLRPGELLDIKSKNVHLGERYIVGGFKTKAGKDRVIPIHKRIHPLIEMRLDDNGTRLISSSKGNRSYYNNYLIRTWNVIMDKLGMEHTPHECRHTFATLMNNAGANEVSVKKIMGHATTDNITVDTYTHKDMEQLLIAVDLLD